MFTSLVTHLQESLGILAKQEIQIAAQYLKSDIHSDPHLSIPVGDDCAAIPDGNGYLLIASEGILPSFLEKDPWFAGWCAVMVNLSDVAAMGGRAIALVDTLWSQATTNTHPIWSGMTAAAKTYGIPIVGGHTNTHSPYTALSMAILGRANRLISGFKAELGDHLLLVIDFQGNRHPEFPFWNAATHKDPVHLRQQLELLPLLAESGLCTAGKDISMGGIIGTLLMLLETSSKGAKINLDAIPCPEGILLAEWLLMFPSYGFLLSVHSANVEVIQAHFHQQNLIGKVIGIVEDHHQLILQSGNESTIFWDLSQQCLTGFHLANTHKSIHRRDYSNPNKG